MLYTCSGDVGGGLLQMTVLQHGAANKHKKGRINWQYVAGKCKKSLKSNM